MSSGVPTCWIMPPVDDDDPVGHGHGLGLVVGYVDHGDAQLGLDLLDLKAHGFAQLGVQVGKRLVQQQQLRLRHQGAAQGHPLLLSARKLGGNPVRVLAQVHHIQDAIHLILNDVSLVHFFDFQGVGHIFKHGHVRPHGVGLEHHADVPALRGHKSIFPAHQLIADVTPRPLVGFSKPGDDAQHGGFAAARGAQEGDEFLVVENLIELLEYHHICQRLWIRF